MIDGHTPHVGRNPPGRPVPLAQNQGFGPLQSFG